MTDAGRFSGRATGSSAGGRSPRGILGQPRPCHGPGQQQGWEDAETRHAWSFIYVYATCIALAAVVVLMRGISALLCLVLGISAARLLVASKFASERGRTGGKHAAC